MDDPAAANLVDLARRALTVDGAALTAFGPQGRFRPDVAAVVRGPQPDLPLLQTTALRVATAGTGVWEEHAAGEPIVRAGRVSGALAVCTREPRAWTVEDRRTLAICAGALEEHFARLDLVDERTSLQRLATVVATDAGPRQVHATVCQELARVFDVPMVAVKRFDGEEVEMLAAHGIDLQVAQAVCEAIWDRGGSTAAERYRTGVTYRIGDTTRDPSIDARRFAERGVHSVAGAPVFVEGGLWGAIFVGSDVAGAIGADAARRLTSFAELVALAVTNAHARTRLAAEATTDSLTRLANHRRFHEELRCEVARAERLGLPLAVALIDVDDFKQVNDALGHHGGDEVLRHVAGALRDAVRAGELVARLGGDEFAAVLPGTDDVGAEAFGERVRARLQESPELRRARVTVSVGVSDLAHARDADTLVRLADGALYWAKEHGRDMVCRYQPTVVLTLSERDRAERLARGQALTAMRALVRAMDLSDPTTQRHAQRVAQLTQQLAAHLRWSAADRERLGDAALLHDIGKIALPDAILHKPGPLDDGEREVVRTHAQLGGEIVSEALDDEQVAWVHHHHERHDGAGYPAGLGGDGVPRGAALIAVADAFDVMTTARHYRNPVTADEALAECEREAGAQFAPPVVEALAAVLDRRRALERTARIVPAHRRRAQAG